MNKQIQRIHISNFLTGLVFWYGIEKLFLRSIGVDALGISVLTAVYTAVTLLLDIPSGMLADKWSRKGTLTLSAIFLGLASLTQGLSNGLWFYMVGYVFYGFYVVCSSGTYQAMMYDSLKMCREEHLYSKKIGFSYAMFLAGAGAANIASGFLATAFGLRSTFYVTIISCLLNVCIMLSLKEPTFHKPENKESILKDIGSTTTVLLKKPILASLTLVLAIFFVVEVFKSDFGQLYMLRYTNSASVLGILWAIYAFAWAFGSYIAHRFHTKHISMLIVLSTMPYLIMSFIDSWTALILFNLQALFYAVLANKIDELLQQNAPSHLRASISSIISTFGRILAIPSVFAMGIVLRNSGAFRLVQYLAVVMVFVLVYWLLIVARSIKARRRIKT